MFWKLCVFVINYTKKVKSPVQTIKKKIFSFQKQRSDLFKMNSFFYLLKESMCVVEWPGSCLTIVSFVWKEPHMSRLSASFHAWSNKLVCLFMFCNKKKLDENLLFSVLFQCCFHPANSCTEKYCIVWYCVVVIFFKSVCLLLTTQKKWSPLDKLLKKSFFIQK